MVEQEESRFIASKVVPPIGAVLSICGSLLLIKRNPQWTTRRSSPSHRTTSASFDRLIVGLSVYDILFSLRLAIFFLFFRPHKRDPSLACTIDGFMFIFTLGGPLYNGAIGFYYLLAIVYQVTDQRIASVYEPLLHGVPILFTSTMAVLGLILRVYNADRQGITCFASEYPLDCHTKDDDSCIRGRHALIFSYAAIAVPLLCVFVSLMSNNLAVFRYVRKILLKSRAYTNPESSLTKATAVEQAHIPQRSLQQLRLVATQCSLYVAVYVLCFVWSLLIRLATTIDPDGVAAGRYLVLSLAEFVFVPSQGLFNALVYSRPEYMRLRRQTDHSRWACAWAALWGTAAE